jgi:chemotaxis protein MotB
MITLLLVLFIVLFAMSAINMGKYRELKQSATQAMGSHVAITRTTTPSAPTVAPVASSLAHQLLQIQERLMLALSAKGLIGDVSVSSSATGLTVGLATDSAFFGTDSAQLAPAGKEIVDVVGTVLKSYPNAMEVAGYTDNEPITGGPYATNWALSAARAATVVIRLTKTGGVGPNRVALIGYGQYHPLVPNTSPASQAKNRRVDIIVSTSNSFTP